MTGFRSVFERERGSRRVRGSSSGKGLIFLRKAIYARPRQQRENERESGRRTRVPKTQNADGRKRRQRREGREQNKKGKKMISRRTKQRAHTHIAHYVVVLLFFLHISAHFHSSIFIRTFCQFSTHTTTHHQNHPTSCARGTGGGRFGTAPIRLGGHRM